MPGIKELECCGPCNPFSQGEHKKIAAIQACLAAAGLAGVFVMSATKTFPISDYNTTTHMPLDDHTNMERFGLTTAFVLSGCAASVALTYLAMRGVYLLLTRSENTEMATNEATPLLPPPNSPSIIGKVGGFFSTCMKKSIEPTRDAKENQLERGTGGPNPIHHL